MDHAVALGRRERKRQELHQNLLDAAALLFRQRGVARTTVDDIAEVTDVARQTVFNHFPYKEAIALEIASDLIQEVAQCAAALLETGMPALDVLERATESILEAAGGNPEVAVVVAHELLHSDPERAARAAVLLPFQQIFEAILVQGQEEGSLREGLPLESVAGVVSAVLRGLLTQVRTEPIGRLRQEVAVFFDIVFNGIIDRRV